MVGQGQLPRLGLAATADQGWPGAAVMGASKRALLQQPLAAVEQSGHRMEGCQFQGLSGVQRREQARQAPSQHRFAAAGRSAEQQVVSPGGGDLQGAPAVGLSLHIGEIRGFLARTGQHGSSRDGPGLIVGVGMFQMPERLGQVADAPHP